MNQIARWIRGGTATVAIMSCGACASTPSWYWANGIDATRDVDVDLSRCALVGYSAAQQTIGSAMQKLLNQQLAFEQCMAAVGWTKVQGVPTVSPPSTSPGSGERVALVGGPDRATYLGCASCPATDPESIFNPLGIYGARESQTSIFDPLSPYGSAVSSYSVCNPAATAPPVLIDTARRVRGALTLNSAFPGAISDERVLGWLRQVCGLAR
jgi:hypothetical protein